MKVTKYIHSCLVVETDGKKVLIDPGNYTYEAKVLNIDTLGKLDYLLITHEHPDHMYIPFIKEILAIFPNLPVITNSSARAVLSKEGITAEENSPEFIKTETVLHERVFGTEPPENMLFNVGNSLTHPGDSLHFTSKTPILALPVQAPWCSLTQAVELGESFKAQVILPIHDWHWNDIAREAFYKRLEGYFASKGIKFIGLKTGETVSI